MPNNFFYILCHLALHGTADYLVYLHDILNVVYTGCVEQTSNTMQWVLYHLTKYPNTLRKLEREVRDVIPPGGDVTKEHIDRMPYLRAVIKEVLR